MNSILIKATCLYLGFMICLLLSFCVKPPTAPIYRYRDTIRFCDRGTDDVRKTIRNAEFRVLGKNDIMYGLKVKADGKETEILVMEKVPMDCYVGITEEPE